MTIESSRWNLAFILFSETVFLFVGGLFAFGSFEYAVISARACLWFGIGIWIVSTFFCARWFIAVFRKITLNEHGITVSLMDWKRFYAWESISASYESYDTRFGMMRAQYEGEVILSSKRYKKPRRMPALLYGILIHPCSFVWVHFAEESRGDAPAVYSVRRQEFIAQMEQWGVKMKSEL